MSHAYLTFDFCENLVRRLKAGECPEALRVELTVGSATMARYVQIARARRNVAAVGRMAA